MTQGQSDFDRVARSYRILEYLALGRMLERTREYFLPALKDSRHALAIGDGDGRFLARLMKENRQLRAVAVDTSAAMLQLLEERCQPYSNRLDVYRADARQKLPQAAEPYDLVVTHFFLDCLNQDELRGLVLRVKPLLAPRALWVISDFRIPDGPLGLPAWFFIRGLYLCFRILTDLRTARLPDHVTEMSAAGFACIDRQFLLAGVLVTEVWQNDIEIASKTL